MRTVLFCTVHTSRSNKKQIDWDQLDKEVSEELEGEKLEGDAALNKLFKDIYDRADEVCICISSHLICISSRLCSTRVSWSHSPARPHIFRSRHGTLIVTEQICLQVLWHLAHKLHHCSGHTASNEQVDADQWRNLPQHELGRSSRKGLRIGADSSKGHGVEEVSEMKSKLLRWLQPCTRGRSERAASITDSRGCDTR